MTGEVQGRSVTIRKTNAAESEEMKCCGGSWSIQKGLSCLNGDDDDHDQGEQGMLKSTAWETERERWGDRGDDDGQSKEGEEVRSSVDGGDGDCKGEERVSS